MTRADPGRTPSARLTLRARLLLAAVLALLCAAALEGAFRGYLAVRGDPQSPGAIRDEARLLLSRVTDTLPIADAADSERKQGAHKVPLQVHPYAGFHQEMRIDEIPAQRAEFQVEGPYRILLLGGSVAAGFDHTGMAEVVKRLRASPALGGREVEVINQACPGHKQPQQLEVLGFLLAVGYRPDLVLNLDGHNEVALGFANRRSGAFPPYPSGSHWTSVMPGGATFAGAGDMARLRADALELEGALASAPALTWSAVVGHLLLGRVRRLVAAYAGLTDEYAAALQAAAKGSADYLLGPDWNPEDDDATADLLVQVWMEASLSMHAMCAARGIRYVHALQPTLHDPGAKVITSDEERLGKTSEAWLTGVRLGYPRLRAAGEVLRQRGVHFVDMSRVFAGDERTLFVDACHFNRRGQITLGDALGAALVAILESE